MNKKIKSSVFVFSLLFLTFLFFSCASSNYVELPEQDTEFSVYVNPQKNIVQDGNTFLFFRLYEPIYNRSLCIENILKKLINSVEVNGIVASHSAIGFSLEDEFVGITSSEGTAKSKNLGIERCTDIQSNEYMSKCNPELSFQTTYSLEVTVEEFDKALAMVNQFMNDPEVQYSQSLCFAIAGYELKRRYFTPKEERNIKTMPPKDRPLINDEDQKDFNCSSIVAYILINSVESVRIFFEERGLNYEHIIPSDIAEIPGVKKLFTSTWEDYDTSAAEFMKENWNNM